MHDQFVFQGLTMENLAGLVSLICFVLAAVVRCMRMHEISLWFLGLAIYNALAAIAVHLGVR